MDDEGRKLLQEARRFIVIANGDKAPLVKIMLNRIDAYLSKAQSAEPVAEAIAYGRIKPLKNEFGAYYDIPTGTKLYTGKAHELKPPQLTSRELAEAADKRFLKALEEDDLPPLPPADPERD